MRRTYRRRWVTHELGCPSSSTRSATLAHSSPTPCFPRSAASDSQLTPLNSVFRHYHKFRPSFLKFPQVSCASAPRPASHSAIIDTQPLFRSAISPIAPSAIFVPSMQFTQVPFSIHRIPSCNPPLVNEFRSSISQLTVEAIALLPVLGNHYVGLSKKHTNSSSWTLVPSHSSLRLL